MQTLLLISVMLLSSFCAANAASQLEFKADERRFIYHADGEGKTLLLLGGGPGFSSWNLNPIQQHLAAHHRVLRMDMRGIADNKQGDEIPAQLLQQWIHDIEALRQHEQTENWVLIGHSWGALMAQLYARVYPERVAGLILLNPVDPQLNAMQSLVERIDDRQRQAGLTTGDDWQQQPVNRAISELSQQQLEQVLPTYFFDIQQGQTYAKQFSLRDIEIPINHAVWQSYQQQPMTTTELQTLASRLPLEFIGCRHDLLMPQALHSYQNILPNLSHQTLENCVHFPWEETPKPFFNALDKSLHQVLDRVLDDLTPEERAWLEDDSELDLLVQTMQISRGELRFLSEFDPTSQYHMTNKIELTQQSLIDGWGELTQCHYNLDAVAALQIIYRAEHTRDLRITNTQGIQQAWVEGASVQLEQISQGAQLCISAQTYALQPSANGYVLERGPFMRRFLDGYYPLQIALNIQWPPHLLQLVSTEPSSQNGAHGISITTQPGLVAAVYRFEGILQPRFEFKSHYIKN